MNGSDAPMVLQDVYVKEIGDESGAVWYVQVSAYHVAEKQLGLIEVSGFHLGAEEDPGTAFQPLPLCPITREGLIDKAIQTVAAADKWGRQLSQGQRPAQARIPLKRLRKGSRPQTDHIMPATKPAKKSAAPQKPKPQEKGPPEPRIPGWADTSSSTYAIPDEWLEDAPGGRKARWRAVPKPHVFTTDKTWRGRPLTQMNIPHVPLGRLHKLGIRYIGQLEHYTQADLNLLRYVGRGTARQIVNDINQFLEWEKGGQRNGSGGSKGAKRPAIF